MALGFSELAKSSCNSLLDFLYPPRCAICRESVPQVELRCRESFGPNVSLCGSCTPQASYERLDYDYSSSCLFCQQPSERQLAGVGACRACLDHPLPLRCVRSLWHATPRIHAMITEYKYRGHRSLKRFLISEFERQLHTPENLFPICDWNLVVSVPSTRHRLRERGFLHLAPVAQRVAGVLRIPYSLRALESHSEHIPQAQCRAAERGQNIAGQLSGNSRIVAGKRVLLIDDVLTTGASICEATRALHAAGTQSVDALTFARSLGFSRHRLRPQRKSG